MDLPRHDPPLCVSRGRPRNVDNPANPDRPRVTNHRLPRRAAGDVLPAHGLSIGAAFHVTWEVVPLAFASATRSSVARMISSTPRPTSVLPRQKPVEQIGRAHV